MYSAEGSMYSAEGSMYSAEGSMYSAEGSMYSAEGSMYSAKLSRRQQSVSGERIDYCQNDYKLLISIGNKINKINSSPDKNNKSSSLSSQS